MKKLSIFNKLVYTINLVCALLLFFSLFSGVIPAEKSGFFAILSLLVPVIILLNALFIFYWLFRLKRLFLLSLILILISFLVQPSIYKINKKNKISIDKSITVLSYNTRSFNENEQLNIQNVDSLMIDFFEKEDADILCFQEFHYAMKNSDKPSKYPYKFIDFIYGEHDGGVIQAIYSKYPILKVKPIEFPKSNNSALYADILINTDTIRFYNIHLQSFRIQPEVSTIKNSDSKRLFGRIKKVMGLQKEQIEIIKAHYNTSRYKKVLVGDFNNTSFSNIYGSIKGDFQDSFLEAGKGFGRTYDLKGLPMRIDYIMADDSFEILKHQNYDVKLSDHYPIKATLRIKD